MLISAVTGDGCDELLDSVASKLALDQERVTIELDLTNPVHADRLAWLYRHATVHSHATMGDRATLEADVPRRLLPMVGLAKPSAPRAEAGVAKCRWPAFARASTSAKATADKSARMLCVCVLVVVSACAPKVPPAVVGAPKHPDYMFPIVPPGAVRGQASRVERGWTVSAAR